MSQCTALLDGQDNPRALKENSELKIGWQRFAVLLGYKNIFKCLKFRMDSAFVSQEKERSKFYSMAMPTTSIMQMNGGAQKKTLAVDWPNMRTEPSLSEQNTIVKFILVQKKQRKLK